MVREKVDSLEMYFPTDPEVRLEYVLQRAKKVLAEKTRIVTVHEVKSGPQPMEINEFPSVEVVVRILGIPFEHPLTHQPIIPLSWFTNFFQSEAMRSAFVGELCRHVAESAPDLSRLNPIKRKLRGISTGRPSKLPPKLDLWLMYLELIKQVRGAKQWLKQWRKTHNALLANSREEFLQALSSSNFWWLELIKTGQFDVVRIASNTAESTCKSMLAKKFGVTSHAIHTRLSR